MLEIVTHCWRYSGLLGYHLGSLVNCKVHPVRAIVYTCIEDRATIERVEACQNENKNPLVYIDLRIVDKSLLLRRAIMRNRAATETEADFIWFCDADYVFGPDCLDTVPGACRGNTLLWFPAESAITSQEIGDVLAGVSRKIGGPLPYTTVYGSTSGIHRVGRAIGGLQIVTGDTARHYGYCRDHKRLMRPADEWQVTTEDHAYRRALGTCGTPIQLPNLFRIRHSVRGYIEKDVEL